MDEWLQVKAALVIGLEKEPKLFEEPKTGEVAVCCASDAKGLEPGDEKAEPVPKPIVVLVFAGVILDTPKAPAAGERKDEGLPN